MTYIVTNDTSLMQILLSLQITYELHANTLSGNQTVDTCCAKRLTHGHTPNMLRFNAQMHMYLKLNLNNDQYF